MRNITGLSVAAVIALVPTAVLARSGSRYDDAALRLLHAVTSFDNLLLIASAAAIALAASILLAFAAQP